MAIATRIVRTTVKAAVLIGLTSSLMLRAFG